MSSEYLVEVQDLKQYFPVKTGFMKNTYLKAMSTVYPLRSVRERRSVWSESPAVVRRR